uniref:Pollen-specific protein-like n=1 Tax=Noccaea caerulescens TaxID=107243 RepID=A0A1J3HR14_NOCCA
MEMEKKLMMLVLLLQLLFLSSLSLKHSSAKPNAKITVMGLVYCDVCSNNSFSKHSYFMPGVEVRIICRFNAASSRTREMITFSANRTTNDLGLYKLDITSLEGVTCAAEADKASPVASCQASLIGGSSDSCNVPGYKTTTDQVVFKSKRSNLCVYGFTALNFRPFQKNLDLCGKQ